MDQDDGWDDQIPQRSPSVEIVEVVDARGGQIENGGEGNTQPGLPWYHDLGRNNRLLARLIDCWLFSEEYDAKSFGRTVMIQMQRFNARKSTLPGPKVVKYAIDRTQKNSALYDYLVLCCAHYPLDEDLKAELATLNGGFLVDVLHVAKGALRMQSSVHEQCWCEYHDHEDHDSQYVCKASRQGDPDVIASVAAYAPGYATPIERFAPPANPHYAYRPFQIYGRHDFLG